MPGSFLMIAKVGTAGINGGVTQLLFDAIRGYAAKGQGIILVSHNLDEVVRVADTATILRATAEARAS